MTIINVITLIEHVLGVKVAMNANRKSSPAKTARYCAMVIMYEEGFTHMRIAKYFKVDRSVITKTLAEADRLIQNDKGFKAAYLNCVGAVTQKYDLLEEADAVCNPCDFKFIQYRSNATETHYRVSTIDALLTTTAKAFGLAVYQVMSRNRSALISEARHMTVLLIHKFHHELTLQQIGEIMKGRHHTSILYSIRVAQKLIIDDWSFRAKYQTVTKKLKQNDTQSYATAG